MAKKQYIAPQSELLTLHLEAALLDNSSVIPFETEESGGGNVDEADKTSHFDWEDAEDSEELW